MDEATIKAEVLNLIRRQSPTRRRPIVATEFQILSGQTRADLAILDDEFVGVEIKSKLDTLKRLIKQAHDYRKSFDRTILVLDGSHLVKYLSIDLDFCDVWTFDEGGNLRLFSEGVHERVSDEVLFGMLTMREREVASKSADLKNLSKRQIFYYFFSKKFKGSSDKFWLSVRGRKIKKNDLELLSRFKDVRVSAAQVAYNQEREWENWIRVQSQS